MHLRSHERHLHQIDDALYTLTGILTYGCLPRQEKAEVTTIVYNIITSKEETHETRAIMGHLHGIISQLSVNHYWYCWSLTDDELRKRYNLNRKSSDAIEFLGLSFDAKINVATLAAGVLAISKGGLGNALADSLRKKLNMDLGSRIGRISGRTTINGRNVGLSLAMVTIFAGVIHAMTSESARQGRRELMARSWPGASYASKISSNDHSSSSRPSRNTDFGADYNDIFRPRPISI